MEPRSETAPPGGGGAGQAGDATRRTHLANERTYLAWWRTGITSLAAGIGVGRVVPSLTHQVRWPYAVLGVGYAILGIVAIAYGLVRERAVRRAVETGGYAHSGDGVLLGLTLAGVVLGLMLVIVVVFEF